MKNDYSHLPWKELAGVRDKLIHHYFGVNLDIVWNIVKAELTELTPAIRKIITKKHDQISHDDQHNRNGIPGTGNPVSL